MCNVIHMQLCTIHVFKGEHIVYELTEQFVFTGLKGAGHECQTFLLSRQAVCIRFLPLSLSHLSSCPTISLYTPHHLPPSFLPLSLISPPVFVRRETKYWRRIWISHLMSTASHARSCWTSCAGTTTPP